MFGSVSEHMQLIDTIRNNNDYYLLGHDFTSYLET